MSGERELLRWEEEIKVVFVGRESAPPDLYQQITHLFAEYHEVTGNAVSLSDTENAPGNTLVIFTNNASTVVQRYRTQLRQYVESAAALDQFASELPVKSRCIVRIALDDRKFHIAHAILIVNMRVPAPSSDQLRSVKHEIARSVAYLLGALNPLGATRFESVTNPRSTLTDFSEEDKVMLKLLYSKDLVSSMDKWNVIKVLRSMN